MTDFNVYENDFVGVFQLVLVAMDHGSPTQYETLRFLTILLVDTNDNRPEFPDSTTANPYKFYIRENSDKDIRIGKLLFLF